MTTYKFTNEKELTFEYSGFSLDGYMCFYFGDAMLYYSQTRISEMLTKGLIVVTK